VAVSRRVVGAVVLALSMVSCVAASASGPGVGENLVARARAEGTVQVIVTLRVPADSSAPAIDSAKQSVLAAVAPTRHRVLHALPNFPQLVLDASEDALRALGASPHVLRIQESIPARPSR
jgi:hypothetical protein